MIQYILKRSEVFLGLNNSDLKSISELPSSRKESYGRGHMLFKARSEAKNVYILDEGQIDIMVEAPPGSSNGPGQVTIDRITKGGFLGWSAIVRPHLYVLTAVCSLPSTVAIINGKELQDLFDANHDIGYRVLQSLTQVIGTRFRDLEQVLINGKRWPFIEKFSGT